MIATVPCTITLFSTVQSAAARGQTSIVEHWTSLLSLGLVVLWFSLWLPILRASASVANRVRHLTQAGFTVLGASILLCGLALFPWSYIAEILDKFYGRGPEGFGYCCRPTTIGPHLRQIGATLIPIGLLCLVGVGLLVRWGGTQLSSSPAGQDTLDEASLDEHGKRAARAIEVDTDN